MDVRKTIAELTSQLSEINYDSDEDNILLKDSTNDCLASLENNDYEDVEPSKLRKTNESITLPVDIYGGKVTTRQRSFSSKDPSDDELVRDTSEDESSDHNGEGSDNSSENKDDKAPNEDDLSEFEDNEDDTFTTLTNNRSKDKNKSYNIYSSGNKNISSDIKKGAAIRNQLRIWESLLECRIKLQKALAACNNLPRQENLIKIKVQLDNENQHTMNKCKKSLLLLLEKMVDIQNDLLNHCQEYKKNKELDMDEEIKSDDDSEIDSTEKDEDEEEEHSPRKKRKLNDYSSLIKNNHSKFIPFRNASIQKWNDKTKVSTGKMANSNFSAFDHSTLKQIEQIMADKNRLINRTRIKRNECHGNSMKNQEQSPQETTLDAEIFDDTDFYHKLLRDYIERKSVDATNSSHSERQLVELQKLRSKMKKNIDTKSTKGRKLRYVVLPKLVNFMAPDPYNTWSEQAESELYNSLFGKIKV